MDVRLVQLMGSFIGARSQYALARLEFAMQHPAHSAPPLIGRMAEPTERALRDEWPLLEVQLEDAMKFAKTFERAERNKPAGRDRSLRALQQSLRELDQYARAIRWVLTVTECE